MSDVIKVTGKLVPTNEIRTVVEHVTRRQGTPILFTIYLLTFFSIILLHNDFLLTLYARYKLYGVFPAKVTFIYLTSVYMTKTYMGKLFN